MVTTWTIRLLLTLTDTAPSMAPVIDEVYEQYSWALTFLDPGRWEENEELLVGMSEDAQKARSICTGLTQRLVLPRL